VSKTCRFSIIIPVLYESKVINALLESLEKLRTDRSFEVIVVDGSPTQDTLQVITNQQIIKIACRQGRGYQMNTGAAQATGEILVFLHADTFIPSNAFFLMQSALSDPRYIGGAFSLDIEPHTRFLKMIATYSTLRSRFTKAPYGDQVIFVRKNYFHAIGGYSDIPLMEDVELMRRIRRKKGRINILPEKVSTSDRRWREEGFLYTFLRDNLIIILYWCGIPAEKLARFYPVAGTKEKKPNG
jgi:rSAM/selenodomain-associated transferase 2